ncbi:hypothetical protein [Marinoscillum pacificum]|uniref:hypothetical protein n=1 Tax=Marinoscillum pacificum TaxID=392723 RepID=UPI0021570F0B|nr:hypothetical protein [Marinoscillum pacificum]
MQTTTRLFHLVSYLQYPFNLVGFWYLIKIYKILFTGFDGNLKPMLPDIQNTLVFMGIGLSFSTLQDTTTTQNKFSKKIWQSPRKGKLFLLSIGICMSIMLTIGLVGLLSKDTILSEISLGLIVLAIGILGVLKAAIEMFENHRLDKNG